MRLQLTPFGSLNKNPIYIGKVQRAVDGRVIVLITTMPSLGVKLLTPIIRFLEGLSMRNFYYHNFVDESQQFFVHLES
jgi:hypothetical protein